MVLDAGSTDSASARQRWQAAEEVIGEAAGAAPLRVLVATPALEALLFRRPAAVERAFGPVAEHVLEVGRLSPRDALEKLDPGGSSVNASLKLINTLDDADIASLRDESPIQQLLEVVEEVRHGGVVVTGAGGR